MHTALEKANSLAENGGGKMSKRKSKNHRKHQQSSQESCTSGPTATVKAAVTTNGTGPDPVKAISKKLEECLHVRENGCTESDLLVVPPRAVVVQQDDDDPIESGKYSHSGNYNTTVTQNGNVDHSASDRSNKIKINKKIESREPSNGAEKKHFAVASSSVTCAAVNGVHSSPESCSQSSQSSSNSSTEQISNKNECQGLGLEKYVAEASSVPAALTETDSSSGQVNGVVDENAVIEYKEYESELQMQDIMRLIQTELSEPYSIYTYRYFIYNWPKLCFLAAHGDEYVGAIVCKLDMHMNVKRGYIAMLAVKKEYRKMKIGTNLVQKAIEAMLADDADEVVLETEMKNLPALRLYENLGFVRDKRLFRYYLNGVDALRLKLWFR